MATFAIKLVAAGLSFLVSMFLARMLAVENFGHFSTIVAIVSILAIVGNMGLNSLCIRETAAYMARQDWARLRGFLAFSWRVRLLATLIVMLFFGLWGYLWVTPELRLPYLLGVPLILLMSLNTFRAALLRGMHHVILANLPEQVLRPLFVLPLILLAPWLVVVNVATAVWIQLIGAFLALLIGGFWLRRRMPREMRGIAPVYESRVWWKEALPFYGINLLSAVSAHFMVVLAAGLGSATEAGLLNVALRVVDIVAFGLTAANLVIQPRLARSFALGDLAQTQRLAQTSAKVAGLVGVTVCVALIFGGQYLLSLFGKGFEAAYPALMVLVVGQVVNALTGSCGAVAAMGGLQKHTFNIMLWTTVASAVIGVLCIPLWGATGGAMAKTTTLILGNGLLAWLVWRKLGVYTLAVGGARFGRGKK